MSVGERACIYACLILHDGGIAITADKIATLAKAANVTVESYWPRLFAKLSEKKNLDELIINIGAAAATDDKEWTIGLPKPSVRDTNAVDSSSSSEWSYDEESEQDYISRDPYSKESEEAVKQHLLENTDWYRMRMDEINTPRPPPPAPLPVPSPLPPPAGYMSLEEQNKALDEFLEEHSKKSGTSSHNAVIAYLTKKILKDSV